VPYIPDLIPADERARYAKGNMGARAGLGARPVVLVVDMTRTFTEDRFPMGSSKAGGPCTQAIRRLVDLARALGIPVIYSRYDPFATDAEWGRWLDKGSGAEPNSPLRSREAHEIVDLIAPQAGDVVVTKSKPSAFFGTQLASLLTYFKADSTIVTGMVTSGCVRATVVDAFSYNYRVVVPIECVADRSNASHQMNLFDMDMKYADVLPLEEVLATLRSRSPMIVGSPSTGNRGESTFGI
jgi:maleamate amidohydrolase